MRWVAKSVARSRAASSAHKVALDAVSWITPPPSPPERKASGRPSISTSQSSTWVSSSVQAGLVAHSIPWTPRPAESSSPRIEGPELLGREVGEEIRRLPVGSPPGRMMCCRSKSTASKGSPVSRWVGR